jgi:hypothetical protein
MSSCVNHKLTIRFRQLRVDAEVCSTRFVYHHYLGYPEMSKLAPREGERAMTAAQPPLNLPLAGALAEESAETETTEPTGPTVGDSDAEADAAASGADADLTGAVHDSDGVPVGRDDLEADKRASGA